MIAQRPASPIPELKGAGKVLILMWLGRKSALPAVAPVKQIYEMPHEASGSKMGHIRRVSGRYSLLGASVRGRPAWPWRRAGGGSTILLNWGWRIGIGVLLATLVILDADAQPRGTPTRAQQGPALPPSGHQTEPVDLNEGKSPAELFQSGCAVCHQSAAGLAKGRREGELTGFLRQHYTSSVQHAGALAGFLASRGGPAVAAPPRQAPVERPPASIGRRPADEDRKPQEASRPPEREPASKRKPPAAAARTPPPQTPPAPQAVGAAAGATVEVQEPAPEVAPEPSEAVSTPPPVEEKPAAPEIPL
jgi:hypothetical protein